MTWQEEFQEALVAAIIRNGTVVSTDANYFGWGDYEATAHLHGYDYSTSEPVDCSVVSHGTPEEDDWYEFDGTFNDSKHAYGMAVKVTCDCKLIEDREVRWEESFGEALRLILMETNKGANK